MTRIGVKIVATARPESLLLPNLETFSKAAELSSFTGAAKALRLSQAAVSQRVQSLEKALGSSLFSPDYSCRMKC
jgi:Bacterial regulatory helix-turn-helix protein, lysR family